MKIKFIVFFVLLLGLSISSCKNKVVTPETKDSSKVEKVVPENLKWSERMMLSEIERFPDPTLLDFRKDPKWSYTPGLVLSACAKVNKQTGILRLCVCLCR